MDSFVWSLGYEEKMRTPASEIFPFNSKLSGRQAAFDAGTRELKCSWKTSFRAKRQKGRVGEAHSINPHGQAFEGGILSILQTQKRRQNNLVQVTYIPKGRQGCGPKL